MKRLLNSTAALSVALLHVQPWPLMAQTITDTGSIIAADGTVLCEPTAELACDPENADLIAQAKQIEEQIAKAEADAATAAEAEAKTKADADTATAAEDEAKAKADADAATAAEDEAKAKADAAKPAPQATADAPIVDPNAGLKTAVEAIDPAATPIDAPVVTNDEMQALSNLLSGETNVDETAAQPMAATDAKPRPADAAPSDAAVTATTEVVTDETSRSATQEFTAAPQVVAPGKKNRLSDLEKAGLVGLGALVVGAIITQGNRTADTEQPQQQVISNTGDRVIVQRPDGNYQVYKDDDALLRRPGNTLRTETYKDGSTLTTVDRGDGTQIVTIRNATGRVLRRAHYDNNGVETVLFNDLEPEREIVISSLPKPRERSVVISTQDGDAAMKAALARRQIEKIGRTFSLRQVRDIPQVRHLAAVIDVDKITFASGSAALTTAEVNALSDLGTAMLSILDGNKNEVFLIEGHTDATGAAAMNLALSDRRAETVALALTQYFDIPPENMVVQGYGETELLIDTQADEKRNRRVGVRIITPLL
jgi:outer membrane protein OmpA-like peptidoglycan-associated protein